jgi:hypothetical protein
MPASVVHGSETRHAQHAMSDVKPRRDTTLESEAAAFLVLWRLLLERITAFKNDANHLAYDLIAANADRDRSVRILWRAGSATLRVCRESGLAGHRHGRSPAAAPGHRRHHGLRRLLGNQCRGQSIEAVIGLSMSLGSVSLGSAGASHIVVRIGAVSGETRFAIGPPI